jgi:hypothetical protein
MSAVPQNNNPFAENAIIARPASVGVLANTDQARAVSEVQAAMAIARMNPRDPVAAMDRILNACSRQSLADAAVYTYSRGGTDISGPSIRLAEAIAQGWQNMSFGIRELEQRNGVSTVQAYAWDMEHNTRREVTFQVPHMRSTKKGSYKVEDARDVYELVANNGARRLRSCILAVIPGDVTEAAVTQCELTMRTKADTSPEAMQKMVTAFEAFGVTKEQIETRIQRRLDAIQPAQVVSLKKIYASLRDAMSSVEDWFQSSAPADEPATNETRADAIKDALKKKAAANSPPNGNGAPLPVPDPPKQAEPPQDDNRPLFEDLQTPTAIDAIAAFAKFNTTDLLDEYMDQLSDPVKSDARVMQRFKERRDELKAAQAKGKKA